MRSCSILSFNSKICPERCEPSLKIIPAATTGRLMPHALPRTALLGTKQYCMFLYSQSDGRIISMSKGSQSAASITTYTALFVISFRTSLMPFLTWCKGSSCWRSSQIFLESFASAKGSALSCFSVGYFFGSDCYAASNMLMNYF